PPQRVLNLALCAGHAAHHEERRTGEQDHSGATGKRQNRRGRLGTGRGETIVVAVTLVAALTGLFLARLVAATVTGSNNLELDRSGLARDAGDRLRGSHGVLAGNEELGVELGHPGSAHDLDLDRLRTRG